jgi:transcriptional regulator GlxA family with amidase domain
VRRHASSRRIIVVIVPPVDELDLVGPLQVFNSVNRLAGWPIYTIEVVTNANRLTVDGEGGVLTFVAKHRFNKVAGVCDSVLLVCGLGSRSTRDAALSAWLRKMAVKVRRLGAVCVGVFLLAEAGLLNRRRATTHWKFGRELATRYPDVRVEHRSALGQGWEYLHIGRYLRGHRSRPRVGGRGLRWVSYARGGTTNAAALMSPGLGGRIQNSPRAVASL